MALLNSVRSSLLHHGRAFDGVVACANCVVSARGVRQRRAPHDAPAEFVADVTTFADRQAAVLDPHTILPYDPEELKRDYLDRGLLTKKAYAMTKAKMKYQQRFLLNLNFDHIPIEEQIVLMFPGQGAQHIGMGAKVIDHPSGSQLFEEASAILGYDLLDVCRRGPKTKLDQTVYCQVAVFVASMAALAKLKAERPGIEDRITAAAGFSVGEYCALVAADVLSFIDAVKVIKVRAEAMHRCCELVPSGMLTVRVTAASQLDEAMKKAREVSAEQGQQDLCFVANYLYCGVKVVGGSDVALDYLVANANRYKFQDYKFPHYVEVGPGRQLGAILHQVSKKAYDNYTNYAP